VSFQEKRCSSDMLIKHGWLPRTIFFPGNVASTSFPEKESDAPKPSSKTCRRRLASGEQIWYHQNEK